MQLNLVKRLNNLRNLFQVVQSLQTPGLDRVLAVGDALQKTEMAAHSRTWMKSDARVAAMIAERYAPARPALTELLQLPPDTLGYQYARMLTDNGITAEALEADHPIVSDDDYLIDRLRTTHDLTHIVTGFGIDAPGELGLQAFNLSQNRSPLAVLLIASALMQTLKEGEDPKPVLRAVARGVELADRCDLLIAQRWEEGWNRSVADWRQQLGLPTEL